MGAVFRRHDAASEIVRALEAGNVVVLPHLPFALTDQEKACLHPDVVKEGTKTIKFAPITGRIWGTADRNGAELLASMLRRYSEQAHTLLVSLLPEYERALRLGTTSFRPVEAQGRVQSKRHDGTRFSTSTLFHLGQPPASASCASSPTLPSGKPRVWRVGEFFEAVARRFLPRIREPIPGSAQLMKLQV